MESSGSTLIGKNLKGRYRVDEFIGRGGMADVYKVWDSHLSVHLGMKLLHDELAEDRVFLRRFKREARTLERLKHPNIVRFYGIDQDDIRTFILMDFVDGTTLRREIFRSAGPMKPSQIMEIMGPVCAAIGFAHREGVVHCDVKPANIMIDSSGRVLVADFGISRMTDAATATMVGMGTPAYMAPELVLGQDPTPETDIYSMGVILYEMVTGGERPFTGEHATITGSTSEKVRWEQRHLEPPSPQKWNPEITDGLVDVLKKCLVKDPSGRYRSVQGFLDEIMATLPQENVAGDQYSVVRPGPGSGESLRDKTIEPVAYAANDSQRNKKPAIALMVAGVILMGGILLLSGGGEDGNDTWATSVTQTAAAKASLDTLFINSGQEDHQTKTPSTVPPPQKAYLGDLDDLFQTELPGNLVSDQVIRKSNADAAKAYRDDFIEQGMFLSEEGIEKELDDIGRITSFRVEYRYLNGCDWDAGFTAATIQFIQHNDSAGAKKHHDLLILAYGDEYWKEVDWHDEAVRFVVVNDEGSCGKHIVVVYEYIKYNLFISVFLRGLEEVISQADLEQEAMELIGIINQTIEENIVRND